MVTKWQGMLKMLSPQTEEISLRTGTVQFGRADARIKAVSLTEEHIGKSCFSFAGLVWFWLPGCCLVGCCLPEDAKILNYLYLTASSFTVRSSILTLSIHVVESSLSHTKTIPKINRSLHSFIWALSQPVQEVRELLLLLLALPNTVLPAPVLLSINSKTLKTP